MHGSSHFEQQSRELAHLDASLVAVIHKKTHSHLRDYKDKNMEERATVTHMEHDAFPQLI